MILRTRYAWMVLLLAGLLAGCGGGSTGQRFAVDAPVQSAPWDFGGHGGQAFTTQHYRLYSTAEPAFARSLAGFLEACNKHYVALTGLQSPATEGRVVYLMGSRQQWAMLTAHATGPAARFYLQVDSGAYCHDGVCVLWDMGRLPTYSTAAHEGLHQFLHHALRQPLPSWAEEGLATQVEAFRLRPDEAVFNPADNTLRFTDLRKALHAGRWRSIEQLLNMDAGDNITQSHAPNVGVDYYAQLWALLLMIRTDPTYAAGLERMLAAAAAGRLTAQLGLDDPALARHGGRTRLYNRHVGPAAFRHYIDADLDRFEQRYRRFANDLAGIR